MAKGEEKGDKYVENLVIFVVKNLDNIGFLNTINARVIGDGR